MTELGYQLHACGHDTGACSQREQATRMAQAYQALLADPHVAGIWWYESHDDSTGRWGYLNRNNTKRPAFTMLSEIAVSAGQ